MGPVSLLFWALAGVGTFSNGWVYAGWLSIRDRYVRVFQMNGLTLVASAALRLAFFNG